MKFKSDTKALPPLQARVLSSNIINGQTITFIQSKQWLKLIVPKLMQKSVPTTIELTINKPAEKLGIIRPFSTSGSLAYNRKITASSDMGQFLHDASAANNDNPSTSWVLGRRKNIDIEKYFGTSTHYIRSKQYIRTFFYTLNG